MKATLKEGFGQLKTAEVHTVRWWTFPGEPWQINHDSNNVAVNLNPGVYTDFDAALALADEYDLFYVFVLFNGPTALPRSWLTDQFQRQRLADALGPLFARYRNHPRILAWEIFNEPEWDIWSNKIPAASVQATVKTLADTIHSHSSTPVSVGSATIEALPLWINQSLNFYSPHWYDPMGGDACARCTDAASLRARYGLDGLPIIIGEYYAAPEADTLQRLRDFQDKGYAGAWGWSLFFDRTGDKMKVDLEALRKFGAEARSTSQGSTAQPAAASGIQLLSNWVSPTYVRAGQEVTFYQDLLGTRNTNVFVEFEVTSDQGQSIGRASLDNQPVTADGVASFSASMALPLALRGGEYRVKVSIFSPGRGTLIAVTDWAGSFVVEPAPPTPTPVPSPAEESTPDQPEAPTDAGS